MTKDKFEQYNGLLFCKKCKRFVPKTATDPARVYSDYSLSKCNVDLWIDRHKGIPVVDGFTDEEIKDCLHNFLYDNPCVLNDVSKRTDRSIEDIIKLHHALNIKGKKTSVKCICPVCGKERYVSPSVYLLTETVYCSSKCYWKDKAGKQVGEDNPSYNRVKTLCTYCGKEISIIPYNYNKQNSFGENHNFCSLQCYWNYRKGNYTNERAPKYGIRMPQSQKDNMRKHFLQRIKSENRLNTSIQKTVDEMLSLLKINYEREKTFDFYSVDNYLVNSNKIIEVMGDYWHTSPLKYNSNNYKINDIQKKQLHRDKIKHSYIKNNYGINILYLWEKDIKSRPDVCMKLIKEYIKSDSLQNYNSFNYSIKNDELILNENIVVSYQEIPVSKYRHLLETIKNA